MTPNIPQLPPSPSPLPSSSSRSRPLMEKRSAILAAWAELAESARFADMSVAQLEAATSRSVEARTALGQTRARIDSLIGERQERQAALRSLLKRIVNAVRCEPGLGENSPLYRAMGFVPANERRTPRPVGQCTEPLPLSAASSGSLRARYQMILAAWEQAEGIALRGVIIEELRAAGAALEEKRAQLRQEQAQAAALIGLRMSSDQTTASLIRKVVAAVICHNDHGIDSPLYRAMGYIPGNERKRPGPRTIPSGR